MTQWVMAFAGKAGPLSSRQIDEIRTNSRKEFAEKGEANSGEIHKKEKVGRQISRWINTVIPSNTLLQTQAHA